MYVANDSYRNLTSFMVGYGVCYSDNFQADLYSDFKKWLFQKEGHKFSISWPEYILTEMAEGDEKIASQILFNLFHEYLSA